MSVKAITLYPEHAEAFRLGIRSIETRPRRCNYRGRIALHAGMRDPDSAAARRDPISQAVMAAIPHGQPLTRGAVVASARLFDCVPVDMLHRSRSLWPDSKVGWHQRFDGVTWVYDGERHYGDFTPGRWALLLDDIAPTTERCPACWGTGWRCDCHQVGDCAECNAHDCSLSGCPICTPPGGCGGSGRCDPIPWEWDAEGAG